MRGVASGNNLKFNNCTFIEKKVRKIESGCCNWLREQMYFLLF